MKTVLFCSAITIFCLSILPILVSSRLPAFFNWPCCLGSNGRNYRSYLLNRFKNLKKGEADAQLTKAKAEAESIAIRAKALRDNPQVLMLEAIFRWDGKLPVYLNDESLPTPFVQMK